VSLPPTRRRWRRERSDSELPECGERRPSDVVSRAGVEDGAVAKK